MITLTCFNRQRAVPVDMRRFRAGAEAALEVVLGSPCGPGDAVLGALREIEVSLLSGRAMAEVHRQFLNEKGATDVITFPHGEILVCAPVARDNAARYGELVLRELIRYALHGLLHLHGYRDQCLVESGAMSGLQEKLVTACWKAAGGRERKAK